MPTKEMWLLFRDGNHPLKYFLRKKFGHVYILMRDNFGFWLLIDPMDAYMKHVVLNNNKEDNVPQLLNKNGIRVLRVVVRRKEERIQGIRIFALVNCVTIVKYMLGVKFWVFTPYQLYKRLVKMQSTQKFEQPVIDVTQLI